VSKMMTLVKPGREPEERKEAADHHDSPHFVPSTWTELGIFVSLSTKYVGQGNFDVLTTTNVNGEDLNSVLDERLTAANV
jgi:hypothetical protein